MLVTKHKESVLKLLANQYRGSMLAIRRKRWRAKHEAAGHAIEAGLWRDVSFHNSVFVSLKAAIIEYSRSSRCSYDGQFAGLRPRAMDVTLQIQFSKGEHSFYIL